MSQGPLDRILGVLKVNPILQQDLIGNTASGPVGRTRGWVFGKASIVNNTLRDLWMGAIMGWFE